MNVLVTGGAGYIGSHTVVELLNAGHNPVRNNSEPMSQGTRCRQLGMYVVYESPFNMLCDSPVHYEREQECTDFIAAVPTVWDETVALDGKVGEYVVIARRKGDVWYIGGLTGWTEREYVENAIKAGFQVLGFSDHAPYLFREGYVSPIRMRMDELEGYVDSVLSLRKEYEKDIEIYCGLEMEYFPAFFDKTMVPVCSA